MNDQRNLRSLHDEVRQLARELTQVTTRKVIRDDHTTTAHDLPPLMQQLREAVATGSESGKGRSSGSPSPVSVDAVDLLAQIDTDIAALYVRAIQKDSEPEERILAIAGIVGRWTDVTAVSAAADYLRLWAQEIRTFFDPPRRLHVAAACPACNARMVWRELDGQQVQVPALQVDGTIGCTCLACRHVWPTTQLEHLARVIGCDPIREKEAS
jgi:hypothetical protein